jgi:hypothetical protein
VVAAAHARRERHGHEGRGDDAAAAGSAEDHCRKRLSAGAGGFGEVVAGGTDHGADDAAALEAAGQDVGGEDGEGEGLVFGIGGVGPETGHFGEERWSVDQNWGFAIWNLFSGLLFSAEVCALGEVCTSCEGLSGEERRSANSGLTTVWTACPPRGMAPRICIHLGQGQLRPLASRSEARAAR